MSKMVVRNWVCSFKSDRTNMNDEESSDWPQWSVFVRRVKFVQF